MTVQISDTWESQTEDVLEISTDEELRVKYGASRGEKFNVYFQKRPTEITFSIRMDIEDPIARAEAGMAALRTDGVCIVSVRGEGVTYEGGFWLNSDCCKF